MEGPIVEASRTHWSECLLLDLLRSISERMPHASAMMTKRKHEHPEETWRVLHAVYLACFSQTPAEAQTGIAELREIMDQGSKECHHVATNVLGYLHLQVDFH